MQGKFQILLLVAALYVASTSVMGQTLTPECPTNEEWNACGELCGPTCSIPHPIKRFCPAIECTRYTAGCRCKSGFVRDSEGSGKCILEKDCSKSK